jgi:hypothetical protein
MNNGKSCIICKGKHEDTVTRWTDCRVAKMWMDLLDMKPSNYQDMTPALRKMIFLGLTPDSDKPEVRFNAMCICYLMYTAHNEIRCGTTGVNFGIGKEEDTTDWAKQKLTSAAHGHGYMSKQLTERGKFGSNIVGKASKPKRGTPGKDAGKAKRCNSSAANTSAADIHDRFTQGTDLNLSEVRSFAHG